MLKIRSKVCFRFGRVGVSAHYIDLLIYTMQARSTTNGKIRREIQNPQMFETDRRGPGPSPFPQQSTLESKSDLRRSLGLNF
jgi:hypothetical protein